MSEDALYLKLKGAREKLCVAQMHATAPHRKLLQEALDLIDIVGSSLPQWSRYDQPTIPEDMP